jgi:uncharacterized protein involved in cysteine biosynthesis
MNATLFDAVRLAAAAVRAPAARSVLWRTLGITIAVFVALVIAVQAAVGWFAAGQADWLQTLVDVLGGLATLVVVWLLFPAVATLVAGTMLEGFLAAVERRTYPDTLPPRTQSRPRSWPRSWISGAASGARFALFAIGINLALLPAYAVLLFTPFGPVFFFAVNGFLLGRAYFDMVALRQLHPLDVKDVRKAHSGRVFFAVVIIALAFAVPFVNLLTPMFGVAMMAHLFHGGH